MTNSNIRGRWAPSPTGLLHLGSARTALAAWLSVRAQGGTFVWRTEDLDTPRTIAGTEEAAMEDLLWLGLDWDEGPRLGGPAGPYRQSRREAIYRRSLTQLFLADRLFPCTLSRADIRRLSAAQEEGTRTPAYKRDFRPVELQASWFEQLDPEAAIRFAVEDQLTRFDDLLYGTTEQNVAQYCGDFIVLRRDGVFSYQFAVVVDDIEMGITEVVRGSDLIDSTARQIQLFAGLGATPPTFGHVPTVLEEDGRKLSKRHKSMTIRSLREYGIHPHVLIGYLAHSLGLIADVRPIAPADLVDLFDWRTISREPWMISADLPNRLLARQTSF